MRNRVKKIICLVFALLFIVTAFSFSSFAGVLANNPMKDTSVEDDLEKLGVNTSDYGLDTTADFVSVLDFVEYGYDAGGNQEYYGLFVYVYNPSGKEIRGAYLQMQYTKKDGSETGYKKYRLVEVDCNDESTVRAHTLYKFVVKDSADIAKNVPYAVRTYCVSGIEIRYSITDSSNAIDYAVDGKWTFRGYQENCGREGDTTSTLTCSYEVKETIRTELHSASWFSQTSDLGNGYDYRYEVSSVYFNIPNYYISKYGDLNDDTSGLVAVQGEYYKYYTNGVVVNDEKWVDSFNQSVRKYITALYGHYTGTLGVGGGFYVVNSLDYPATGIVGYDVLYDLSFNMMLNPNDTQSKYRRASNAVVDRLLNVLVPSAGYSEPYVSADDFLSAYNEAYRPHFSTSSGLISGEHFTNSGKVSYNISVTDKKLNDQIKSHASTEPKFKWLDKLFNKELYTDEDGYADIEPLVEVKDVVLAYTDEAVVENYFVSSGDAVKLKAFCKDNIFTNHVYLMRFEVNPYYCPEVTLVAGEDSLTYGPFSSGEKGTGYYFEKAVFHDFDILSFTFKDAKNKVVTVPVSCDPIDIVGSVVPGPGDMEDPNNPETEAPNDPTGCELSDLYLPLRILIVLGAIFGLLFVVNLILKSFGKSLSALTDLSVAIISAPFKGAAKIGKSIMSLSDRKLDRDVKKTNLDQSKTKSQDQHEKHENDINIVNKREDRLDQLTKQRIKNDKERLRGMKMYNDSVSEKSKANKTAKTKNHEAEEWLSKLEDKYYGEK